MDQSDSPSIQERPSASLLNWPGKTDAIAEANGPPAHRLSVSDSRRLTEATQSNVFVQGDNLDTMKVLESTYGAQFKLVYMDPPYNTGQSLLYHDATSFQNWLSMMYPRLVVARRLLANDGLICLSIGDLALAYLRLLADEVFGSDNYINTVAVRTKLAAGVSGGGEDKRLKKNLEYIVIYARDLGSAPKLTHMVRRIPLMQQIEDMRASRRSFKYTNVFTHLGEREYVETITDGRGKPVKIYRRTGCTRSTVKQLIRSKKLDERGIYHRYFESIFRDTNAQTSIRKRIAKAVGPIPADTLIEVEYVPRTGQFKGETVTHHYLGQTVQRVVWLKDVAERDNQHLFKRERLGTLWTHIDYNNVGREANTPFPDGKKPIELLKTCIQLYPGNDGLFLDAFAGSGSFGHAIWSQNADDGGRRRYILIQRKEELRAVHPRHKRVIAWCDEHGVAREISALSRHRLNQAALSFSSFQSMNTTIEEFVIG